MPARTKFVSPMALVLGVVLGAVMFWPQIMHGLYASGLIHRARIADVEKALAHGSPQEVITCQPGRDGWEFICDVDYHDYHGYSAHTKYAVISSFMSPVQYTVSFTDRQPLQPASEFFKTHGKPY